MNQEFRNRVFLPLVIPLGLVLAIGGTVAVFALILLYNSRLTALVLASLMAVGVLLSVSLAASRDRLDTSGRAAVLAAGGAPVLIGALIALGVGGIPAEELNINREPHTVIPEDAPRIAAVNAQNFCAPTDGCDTASTVTLPAGQEITMVFDNRDEGVPHNWTMLPSEGSPASEAVARTPDGTGPATLTTTVPPQEPGEFYFVCTIHPNMNGTVTVGEDVTEVSINGSGG